MVTVQSSLNGLLVLCSVGVGLLAFRIVSRMRQLGTAAAPPLQYNNTTLHDFELLVAVEGLLLFASFVAIAAGLYEFLALQTAIRVPLILFTLLLARLLIRWGRRYA